MRLVLLMYHCGLRYVSNKVAQQNYWDYLNAEPPIRKQAFFFPNIAARAEQKIAIQLHATSQANMEA